MARIYLWVGCVEREWKQAVEMTKTEHEVHFSTSEGWRADIERIKPDLVIIECCGQDHKQIDWKWLCANVREVVATYCEPVSSFYNMHVKLNGCKDDESISVFVPSGGQPDEDVTLLLQTASAKQVIDSLLQVQLDVAAQALSKAQELVDEKRNRLEAFRAQRAD